MVQENFFEYYKSIKNKREVRNEIIKICEIQHSTFYAWFVRKKIPNMSQKVISQYLQIDRDILFPKQ